MEISLTIVIELVIWAILSVTAQKLDSDYLFRGCDFFLFYILSGHNVYYTVLIFIIARGLVHLYNWFAYMTVEGVVPELKHSMRMRKYGKD